MQTRVSSHLLGFQLAMLGLAALLLYAGAHLNLAALTSLGIVCIALFTLVSGINAMITKRLGFETQRRDFGPREFYTGLAAQLYGLLFVAWAVPLFGLAGIPWLYPGGAGAFWADFLGKSWGWGIVLMSIGLSALVIGIIRLIAGSAGYYTGLADWVERVGGVIPLLIGLGMATVGSVLIIAPGPLASLARQVATSIQQLIFH